VYVCLFARFHYLANSVFTFVYILVITVIRRVLQPVIKTRLRFESHGQGVVLEAKESGK
jgi:hypothetical protein